MHNMLLHAYLAAGTTVSKQYLLNNRELTAMWYKKHELQNKSVCNNRVIPFPPPPTLLVFQLIVCKDDRLVHTFPPILFYTP